MMANFLNRRKGNIPKLTTHKQTGQIIEDHCFRRENDKMKKIHIFNIISGLIVLLVLGSAIATGSNLLPYALIALFFTFYYLQVRTKLRVIALFGNIIILLFSLSTLLPFLFAP